jgi:hypothetical protein
MPEHTMMAILMALLISILQPAPPSLALIPPTQTAGTGDVIRIDIMANTGSGSADTVDAYIEFDPALLRVVDRWGRPASSVELNTSVFKSATYNMVDNTLGQANLSASVFKKPYLTGYFRVATVRFKAIGKLNCSILRLVRNGARSSDVYLGGNSIGPALGNAFMRASASLRCPLRQYIPMVKHG